MWVPGSTSGVGADNRQSVEIQDDRVRAEDAWFPADPAQGDREPDRLQSKRTKGGAKGKAPRRICR
jgi:hypothetical protein